MTDKLQALAEIIAQGTAEIETIIRRVQTTEDPGAPPGKMRAKFVKAWNQGLHAELAAVIERAAKRAEEQCGPGIAALIRKDFAALLERAARQH